LTGKGPNPSVDILDDRLSETLYEMLERMEQERKKWERQTPSLQHASLQEEPKEIHRTNSKSRFKTPFWRNDSAEKEAPPTQEVEEEETPEPEARIVIGQFGMM
jgi:hypothetical protein